MLLDSEKTIVDHVYLRRSFLWALELWQEQVEKGDLTSKLLGILSGMLFWAQGYGTVGWWGHSSGTSRERSIGEKQNDTGSCLSVPARATIRQGLGHRCCYVMSDNATQNVGLKWGIFYFSFHTVLKPCTMMITPSGHCMHLQLKKWKRLEVVKI